MYLHFYDILLHNLLIDSFRLEQQVLVPLLQKQLSFAAAFLLRNPKSANHQPFVSKHRFLFLGLLLHFQHGKEGLPSLNSD